MSYLINFKNCSCKTRRESTLERAGHRCEDNIKVDIEGREGDAVGRIKVAKDTV
jgi:hypothetical protein